jgi:histidinol-phosphate phosphatase family protein
MRIDRADGSLSPYLRATASLHSGTAMVDRPRQAVILAGGLGTRLRPLTDTVPKPMIPFHGKPFAGYLLEMLREQGITEILFLLGYLPEVVRDYFGDGRAWGLKITYSISPVEDETGTRLKKALDRLDPLFLLLYCDNYWPMDLRNMWDFFLGTGARAMVTVYRNEDAYTRNNVKVNAQGLIEIYDKTRANPDLNGVDIGYGFFPKSVVAELPDGNVSFEKETYGRLVQDRQLAGYVSRHRYYSVGSHERMPLTDAFLARSPAILLDRDGVLNQKAPQAQYIGLPDQVVWLPGALDALRNLKEAGYRVILISNQAGIARGMLTWEGLHAVEDRMRHDAVMAGGKIDAIYVCPHHWDEKCDCRKPSPGMLFRAQREHHLDLSRTWFLGDDERDIQAGEAAGCKTGLVTSDKSLKDWVAEILVSQD